MSLTLKFLLQDNLICRRKSFSAVNTNFKQNLCGDAELLQHTQKVESAKLRGQPYIVKYTHTDLSQQTSAHV